MAALGCRSFFPPKSGSAKNREPYLMDPAMRAGSPPSEAYIELFSNWDEVIWAGADGEMVDVQSAAAAYAAEIILRSEWAREHFLALDYPQRNCVGTSRFTAIAVSTGVITRRHWESARSVRRSDWAIALRRRSVRRSSMREAVEGLELEFDRNALNAAMEAVEQGREFGVEW